MEINMVLKSNQAISIELETDEEDHYTTKTECLKVVDTIEELKKFIDEELENIIEEKNIINDGGETYYS